MTMERRDSRGGTDAGESASGAADPRQNALEDALERGRSALGRACGVVVRVDDGTPRVVAARGEHAPEPGTAPPIPERLVETTLHTDGVLAVAQVDGANAAGRARIADEDYVGCQVTVDGEPYGLVCFLTNRGDPERDSRSAATPRGRTGDSGPDDDVADEADRALVALVAQVVGAEIEATRDRRETDHAQLFNETLFDTVPDVLYAFTSNGQIVQWNDRLEDVSGYDTEEIATMGPLEFIAETDRSRVAASIQEVETGDTETVEATFLTADGERIPYQFRGSPITDSDGEVIGFAGAGRDVSAYREHEATLTALHDTTRELLRAESEAEVCETVVTTMEDVLDIEVSGAYLFDADDNVLRPVAQGPGAEAVVGDPPTIGPGEGVAWQVFMGGKLAVFDDVREADEVYNPDTAVRSELLVPVGEHGVVLAGTTETGAFDERTVELADLLAANAEASLDNVARQRELAARDERLERQHAALRRLNEVNERVRRIGHALVGADDREAIESLVCERLADIESVALAWIGERTADGSVVVRTWAGTERGYLDTVRDELGSDSGPEGNGDRPTGTEEPVVAATRSRDPVVIERLTDDFRTAGWRQAALTRDFRAAAAFPLVDARVPHGVLGVYANQSDALGEETRSVLTELADMAADAIGRVERRQARATGDVVELTVTVAGGTGSLFALTEALGEQLAVTSVVPRSEGQCLLYAETAADSAVVEDALDAVTGVRSGRVLSTDSDRVTIEVTVDERTVADTVREFDGRLVDLTVGSDEARLVAALPAAVDRRAFLSALGTDADETTVLAKRIRTERDPDDDGPLATLTERQRDAVRAAYHAGFFEWPRESSGEEVAADLGVAQPTFVEPLRHAEAKLLADLLDEE